MRVRVRVIETDQIYCSNLNKISDGSVKISRLWWYSWAPTFALIASYLDEDPLPEKLGKLALPDLVTHKYIVVDDDHPGYHFSATDSRSQQPRRARRGSSQESTPSSSPSPSPTWTWVPSLFQLQALKTRPRAHRQSLEQHSLRQELTRGRNLSLSL